MEQINHYSQVAVELFMSYTPRLLLALATLLVGLWLIGIVVKITQSGLKKSNTDETLISFISNLVSWGLKALLALSVASMVGIETTSFIAVLGAAGLAVGLALQGSLANFAGGVLIILFKPYKVGDLIKAQGELGVVKDIQIFVTVLVTLDNKQVIVPNGAMSNGNVVNFSGEGQLRVDLSIGISYDSDIAKAKKVIMKVMESHPKVMDSPAPFVGVDSMGDSSVNLAVWPWATPDDYWDVYFDINEQMKVALDKAKISIPFPQRDVHLYNHQA
ncbi:mechanosensitive ion channel family protein [Pseudoteredinibacter isoporae]|uniref:mechanosensitive ion channel family protein n=1 Tax=Pseudoteredinibacter isoporae TaxID=570281 RepID=UPI00310B8114